ncbi:MAG: hypothetical protein V1740_08055 [Candidatus Woesearchaeota archaeon]
MLYSDIIKGVIYKPKETFKKLKKKKYNIFKYWVYFLITFYVIIFIGYSHLYRLIGNLSIATVRVNQFTLYSFVPLILFVIIVFIAAIIVVRIFKIKTKPENTFLPLSYALIAFLLYEFIRAVYSLINMLILNYGFSDTVTFYTLNFLQILKMAHFFVLGAIGINAYQKIGIKKSVLTMAIGYLAFFAVVTIIYFLGKGYL